MLQLWRAASELIDGKDFRKQSRPGGLALPDLLEGETVTDQQVDKVILDRDDDASSAVLIPDCDDDCEVEDSLRLPLMLP